MSSTTPAIDTPDQEAVPAASLQTRLRRRLRRGERGQVLIIIVLVLIIILVMTLFLFDLSYMVRLRTKTQNGADAAALTAANWQGRSLNMIGEMNLLKASDRLIYGFPVPGPTTDDRMLQSMDLLSELQARVSYVGPLVGYASAQQSAKANQMRPSNTYNRSMSRHIEQVKNIYPLLFDANATTHGFTWLEPYTEMLERVQAEGIAAKSVNSRYLLRPPILNGQFAYLITNRAFYTAVHSRMYCWFGYGMGLDPGTQYSFDDIDIQIYSSYFLGSEFLPLHVDLNGNLTQPDYATMGTMLDDRALYRLPTDSDGEYPEIEWATYGADWYAMDLYDAFNDGDYLRGHFKDEYAGGGAAARMLVQGQPSLISGRWAWEYGDDPAKTKDTSLAEKDGPALTSDQRSSLKNVEDHYETMRQSETVISVSAAKPFGSIGGQHPASIGIVLPVFTDVRLLPVSLVEENESDTYSEFYEFLIDYFGDPNYPNVSDSVKSKWYYYVSAIEAFTNMDSSFHEGWEAFEQTRLAIILGPDGIAGTSDDGRDPCAPPPVPPRPDPPPRGGGGSGPAPPPTTNGGGSSRGGPSHAH